MRGSSIPTSRPHPPLAHPSIAIPLRLSPPLGFPKIGPMFLQRSVLDSPPIPRKAMRRSRPGPSSAMPPPWPLPWTSAAFFCLAPSAWMSRHASSPRISTNDRLAANSRRGHPPRVPSTDPNRPHPPEKTRAADDCASFPLHGIPPPGHLPPTPSNVPRLSSRSPRKNGTQKTRPHPSNAPQESPPSPPSPTPRAFPPGPKTPGVSAIPFVRTPSLPLIPRLIQKKFSVESETLDIFFCLG
jgi:hypothetical protein